MKTIVAFGLAALITSSAATNAYSGQQNTTLNVASTFPGNMPVLGSVSRGLPEKVLRASGGEIILKFHEPGALVPGADTVKAVASGQVTAAWAGAGWFAGEDSAFNMFSSVPFGPGIGEYLAWMYRGGGVEGGGGG